MAFGMAGRPKRRARLIAEGKWPPPGHGAGSSKKIRGSVVTMPSPIGKFDMNFWDRNGLWDFDFVGEPDYSDCDEGSAAERRECREDAKAYTETRGSAHLDAGGYTLALDEGDGHGIYASVHQRSGGARLGAAIPNVLSETKLRYASMRGDAKSIKAREKLGLAFLGKVQAEFLAWVAGRNVSGFLAGMF